ncbi:MAG TPA: NYN domain-containing protein [Candidatus Paceibacterota bacterium]
MSIIKHPEQRVGVFIDTQNIYHSAKNIYHARANFGNILKDSVAGRRLVRARAYAVTTESGEEAAFFEALLKVGIEMRLKELQIFSGGAKKADWDVGLAVDAITASPKLDTVILFTGDGDFVPLVEYLQRHAGCQVEVVSFGRSTSLKLKEACDDFLDMDLDPKRYLMNYRPVRNGRRPVQNKALSDADASREAGDIGRITGVE